MKPVRMPVIIEAVRRLDADVVGLADTYKWKDAFSEQELQREFTYPFAFHIDMNDTRVDKRIGLAVLSRLPARSAKAVRLHNRDAIRLGLDDPRIDVWVVYLDDLSEDARLKEARALDEAAGTGPVVAMGDFNSLWRRDVERVRGYSEKYFRQRAPEFERSVQPVLSEMLRAEALEWLAGRRWRGAGDGYAPSAVTRLHELRMPEAVFAVDHVLARGCRAGSFRVLNGEFWERASDHYPAMATIDN